MRREGKIKKLIDLLLQDFYTKEEIIQLTNVSKNTVSVQLSHFIPKKGYKVIKSLKNGVRAYKLEKIEAETNTSEQASQTGQIANREEVNRDETQR